MSEHSEITLPRLVEGGAFGGRHHEIMVFNFCAVYVFVATMTRFRVCEALFWKILKEMVRIYIVAITRLITC
jgi:hypothetical protein